MVNFVTLWLFILCTYLVDGNFIDSKHIIDRNKNGAASVHCVDVDLDGDMDIIGGAAFLNDSISYYENVGNGESFVKHVIYNNADFVVSVSAADINGDGLIDILASSAVEV